MKECKGLFLLKIWLIMGLVFGQLTYALNPLSLLGSGESTINIKLDPIQIDGKALVDTIEEVAARGSEVFTENMVGGTGIGLGKGLTKALRGINKEIKAQGEEMRLGAELYSEQVTDSMNIVSHRLFDPKNGPFARFSQQIIALGGNIQSDLYWQILGPFAGKVVLTAVGSLALLTTAYYGTKIGLHWMEKQLYRPTVVTEYHKETFCNQVKNKIFDQSQSVPMVLHPLVKDRLESLIKETQNTYTHIKAGKKNVKFSNILLAGAPGTGKTMFAKRLAQESGMSYAFVSAGSFFQEGAGIAAIKELFAWAKKSKGLLLFIDEADGLFVDRTKLDPASEQYKIVCEFLTYLGERSDTFMLVLATNHKVIFDEAMQSRIDDLIEMPLPDQPMREKILQLYINTILLDLKSNGKAFIDSVNECMTTAVIANIAERTAGLSNRDLQAIINSIAKKAFATDNALVTLDIVNRTVNDYIEKHNAFK